MASSDILLSDLSDDGILPLTPNDLERRNALLEAMFRALGAAVAEVTGIATTAGCKLVGSCDLVIAAETSQFSAPGVHIGQFCSTPMIALSRNVSNNHATVMLLTKRSGVTCN